MLWIKTRPCSGAARHGTTFVQRILMTVFLRSSFPFFCDCSRRFLSAFWMGTYVSEQLSQVLRCFVVVGLTTDVLVWWELTYNNSPSTQTKRTRRTRNERVNISLTKFFDYTIHSPNRINQTDRNVILFLNTPFSRNIPYLPLISITSIIYVPDKDQNNLLCRRTRRLFPTYVIWGQFQASSSA